MPDSLQWNLLILVVYGIVVAYVFYQIWLDLDEFISLRWEKEALTQMLEGLKLEGLVGVKFKLKDLYKPKALRELEVTIENKTETRSLLVIWERCTLANFKGDALRVIRVVPGMSVDLSQSQMDSFIAPGQKIKAKITVESALKGDDQGELAIASPIFKPDKLGEAAAEGKQFTLRLVIEMTGPTVGTRSGSLHALPCLFTVYKTPKRRSLYWKPKRKKKKEEED
ncbi:hypothetical protein PN462_01765 [Spirulina sp. CS-785/01]|uniref:hypothetical protein n=1 Tax=Spirulina sp. CS-785/01 TaxID=3021716 RepID=UPI00232BF96F|nr:hypothetical protein [Spirulina sp. CS-785/01]MDB9311811.1 hypothetical protein [Spirulina sp. CS-785/01]